MHDRSPVDADEHQRGSSDTDVNELAVIACGGAPVVTTVTPVAKALKARRSDLALEMSPIGVDWSTVTMTS
nr:hypothetical protein GCM10020093_073910 [Planobispora longispora]